jgi:competence protein ComEA
MTTIVGTLAAFAVGGSLMYQSRSAESTTTTDLLVPLAPSSPAPPGLTVPAAGGEEEADRGNTASADTAPTQSAGVPPRAAATGPEKGTAAANSRLIVYVTGAVKKPGIVTMGPGDRIFQAIHQAGGFKAGAIKDALNLADRLQDGDQIHVPARGDLPALPSAGAPASPAPAVRHAAVTPPVTAARRGGAFGAERPARVLGRPAPAVVPTPRGAALSSSFAGSGSAVGGTPENSSAADTKLRSPGDGAVNINTADLAELQRLVGCGPAMAERILAYRQQIGRFNSPQQLMDVKGVGEKTFAKWEPFVTVK